jgi:hypothetical protein
MSSNQRGNSGFGTPEMKPLDQAVWQAWLAKGRARDNRNRATLNASIRYFVTAVLLVAGGVWSSVAPYHVMVRFVVTAGAMFMMLQALRSANYGVAGLYGAVALVFNPVAPAFTFAGEWQRVLVMGTAILFMTSLYWPSKRLVHHA